MCLVCESFQAVEHRFQALHGEQGEVALRFGGDEEKLNEVLAFIFYGHDLSAHERAEIWRRSLHMGGGYTLALMVEDVSPLEMTGSAYLSGVAHGMKLREMKDQR